jgi:hypothetical protein
MAEARGGEPRWRSTQCSDGACVEVRFDRGDEVLVRSSLQPAKVLRLTTDEWKAFRDRVARGDYD